MTSRNWFFPHTSHAIAELFRRHSASRSGRARRGRATLAGLAAEMLEQRSMMAVTPPSISIDDVTIMEGDDGTKNAAITLRLSQPASTVVSLRFATANGTATAGSDFVAKAGSAILFGTRFAHQKAGNSGRLGRVAPSPWRRYRARHVYE